VNSIEYSRLIDKRQINKIDKKADILQKQTNGVCSQQITNPNLS
jgi:hypothetical protein